MIECVELIDGWYWHDGPHMRGPFKTRADAEGLGRQVEALRLEINKLLTKAEVHNVL